MNDEVLRELGQLYRELDGEIADRRWRCRTCGECCRFARHGQELFCSAPEVEFLMAGSDLSDVVADEACAFLQEARCTRYDRRTLGCRTYFCEAAGGDEMSELSERYVARLKRLHRRFGLAWRYERLSAHLAHRKALSGKG